MTGDNYFTDRNEDLSQNIFKIAVTFTTSFPKQIGLFIASDIKMTEEFWFSFK